MLFREHELCHEKLLFKFRRLCKLVVSPRMACPHASTIIVQNEASMHNNSASAEVDLYFGDIGILLSIGGKLPGGGLAFIQAGET